MGCLFKEMNEMTSNCSFNEQDIQRCPFLRNINKPTNFSFASLHLPVAANRTTGPIFEDDFNFDTAFKIFHGKDGIVPLSDRYSETEKYEPVPKFNPLAANVATISLSAFGPGGPFGFEPFMQKRNSKSSKKAESSHKGDSSTHEALGDEWLENGNCPIAKSFRAVSGVLPLVASALKPPPGIKLRCPPVIVAARAALARTALVKNIRPQPLPEKMLYIGMLGMAANVPLGIWREHTQKFSLSWFIAVHAAVPFIAMLRKSVLMPKTAMVFTVAASILGQVIGSRAERFRLRAQAPIAAQVGTVETVADHGSNNVNTLAKGQCNADGAIWGPSMEKGKSIHKRQKTTTSSVDDSLITNKQRAKRLSMYNGFIRCDPSCCCSDGAVIAGCNVCRTLPVPQYTSPLYVPCALSGCYGSTTLPTYMQDRPVESSTFIAHDPVGFTATHDHTHLDTPGFHKQSHAAPLFQVDQSAEVLLSSSQPLCEQLSPLIYPGQHALPHMFVGRMEQQGSLLSTQAINAFVGTVDQQRLQSRSVFSPLSKGIRPHGRTETGVIRGGLQSSRQQPFTGPVGSGYTTPVYELYSPVQPKNASFLRPNRKGGRVRKTTAVGHISTAAAVVSDANTFSVSSSDAQRRTTTTNECSVSIRHDFIATTSYERGMVMVVKRE